MTGRRELAQFALSIVVFGLVVAPVLHAVVDHDGWELDPRAAAFAHHGRAPAHQHSHQHSHPFGSVEHFSVSFVATQVAAAPVAVFAPVRFERVEREREAAPPRLYRIEQPQGP